MNPTLKPTVSLLVLLGLLDVAVAPAMLSIGGKTGPPPPAAAVSVLFGLAIVAGAYGLTLGARWARRLTIGGLVVREVTFFLSIGATIPGWLRAEGIVTFVGSAVALALVLRLRANRSTTFA